MDRDWLAFSRSSFRSRSLRKLFWLAPLPLLLVLSGCMGGGGSKVEASSSSAADTIAITISSPSDGSTMQSPLAVSAQATGTSAITHMQVLLDSVKVAETSSGNIQASVVAAAGSHQLTVMATDVNGANARKSVGVSVPKSSLSISWPPDGATLPSPVHLSATSSDAQPGISLGVQVDGQALKSVNGNALEMDVALGFGAHTITVSSSDSTGEQESQAVSLSVPTPRNALVMNGDSTVSSLLLDASNGQLRPTTFTALSAQAQSMAVMRAFFSAAANPDRHDAPVGPDVSYLLTIAAISLRTSV